MFNNRVKFMGIIVSIFLFALIGRLYNISIIHNEDYTARIESQIAQEVDIYYPRGRILDRNSIPLTGRNFMEKNLSLPVHVEQELLAKHIIGEIQYKYKDNTIEGVHGVSGLQKMFDKELNGGMPIKLIQYKDGKGQSISDKKFFVYGDHINQGNNIKLTIDFHIQDIIEKEMNSYMLEKTKNTNGESYFAGISVVIIDVQNGEVIGIASLGDQNNKALHSYSLGSVFKTLVAVKALEQGVVKMDEEFTCNGTILIDNQLKHCHKTEGHGQITFKDAFAQSCNIVFYEVANRLTEYNPNGTIKGNEIMQLAKEFGFSEYAEKKKDTFILSDKYSINCLPDSITCQMDVFNMALGQGMIEASPLMATKIMATIANNGIISEPILVKEIINQKGDVLKKYNNIKKRVIDEEVNGQIQSLLEEVTISGTAMGGNNLVYGGIAGKTSTAQNGKMYPHAWFAGYFPINQPKYAMTVFVEEGGTGSGVAFPLFENISEKILKLGQRN